MRPGWSKAPPPNMNMYGAPPPMPQEGEPEPAPPIEATEEERQDGKLILVGYAPDCPFPLNTMAMHYNEYEILGCRFLKKAELLQLIKLIERGKIKPVVTKTFPFSQANEAIEELKEGRVLGRIVLTLP